MSSPVINLEKYTTVINALVPFALHNKLADGLKRLSGKFSPDIRKLMAQEVIRRTKPCDQPANNEAFARFPLRKVPFANMTMQLDKIGLQIFYEQKGLYNDNYTRGFYESLMSETRYQAQLKIERRRQTDELLEVAKRTYDDISFGTNVEVCPKFKIKGLELANGKPLTVIALGFKTLTVHCEERVALHPGARVEFHFPEFICEKIQHAKLTYIFESMELAPKKGCYLRFNVTDGVSEVRREVLKDYLLASVKTLPLSKEQELQRVEQRIERDLIFHNSPFSAVFCEANKGRFIPTAIIPSRLEGPPYLPGGQILTALTKTLKAHQECFVLRARVKAVTGEVSIACTLQQALDTDLLAKIVTDGRANNSLEVWHYRLRKIERQVRKRLIDAQPVDKNASMDIQKSNAVIYAQRVTQQVLPAQAFGRVEANVPKRFVDNPYTAAVTVIHFLDSRRAEPRFELHRDAIWQTSLFTQRHGTLRDISVHGLRIEFDKPVKHLPSEPVKIHIPDLHLKAHYELVGASTNQKDLRFRLCAKCQKQADHLTHIFDRNINVLLNYDSERKYEQVSKLYWDLATQHFPTEAILCDKNRQKPLCAVYQNSQFKQWCETPVQDDASLYLTNALQVTSPDEIRVKMNQWLRSSRYTDSVLSSTHEGKRFPVRVEEFSDTQFRHCLSQNIADGGSTLYVGAIESYKARPLSADLIQRRTELLKIIDRDAASQARKLLQYTHVLYFTDFSILHMALLKAGLFGYDNDLPAKLLAKAS
ncbi:MAG: hypothetical protein GJ680_07850 [Alteromonadaceae bacterium]|nr:hypothetical protein [Alteromonadaceae bacterium]